MNPGNTGCAAGDPLEQILSLYTELAKRPEQDFGWGKGKENARALGYASDWLDGLAESLWESAAAVGNPFSPGGAAADNKLRISARQEWCELLRESLESSRLLVTCDIQIDGIIMHTLHPAAQQERCFSSVSKTGLSIRWMF